MEPTKRIIVNTIAQYTKAILTLCLSLYSTRLILKALTVSDYGVYSVVGGVVAMLGFITNALIITTQRYISFFHGKRDLQTVKKIFKNSIFLHVIIGILLSVILLSMRDFIIGSVLNIPPNRIHTASIVFVITIFMLFLTIVTAPFKALFIAHENIVFIAVVDTIDSVIKLALAISLLHIQADKLLVYSLMMALILLLNLLVYATFSLVKYEECSILVHKKDINKLYLFQLIGFAGWTTYGMGAVAGRNQGTAIILNHFFGTVINAAYGISFQVFGAISFVVTSIMNAINPQIMKAEGGKDREKMLMLACKECKFSASLLSIVVIPFLFEMPTILGIWLEEVPTHTALFCRFVLVSFIFDQTTLGLQTANQAIGNIRKYTLLTYTPKLLYLLIIWLMLKHGCSVDSIMWCYLFIEIYVAAQRVPLLKKEAGLSIKQFGTQVISKIIPVCLFECVCCMICQSLVKGIRFSLLITLVITIMTGIISAWFFTLTSEEQLYVTNTLKK